MLVNEVRDGADRPHPSLQPPSLQPAEDGRDRAAGAFLACLNHEVRTPLSGIIGMVDLLLETELDEDQKEYVSAARACAESLSNLLNATLEYSALEAGQFVLDHSEFEIRDLLESVIAYHLPRAAEKRLHLGLTIEPGLPETMVGDGNRLREILGHLLSNGIKFTNTGSVHLNARASGGASDLLLLTVTDTGMGIAPDRLDSIFEGFRQGEMGLARSFSGLGLGLTLAQKMVSLMEGSIVVESQVGRGSSFRVEVPLCQGSFVPSASPDAIPTRPASPRILAVDDNLVGLKVLRHMLSRRGFRVDCAASAKDALTAAAGNTYDLVLMDLQMPEMDGLTATVALRQIAGYESVPILALTANCSDQVREQCRKHGLQAFLTKPVDSAELLGTITRWLRREASAG
jgi:two-component system, sensor histidine kinase